MAANLPLQLSRFLGREREIAQVKKLLAENRLVTLTGADGIGKTRLALEVTSQVASSFEGGAWFVELASLADWTLVPRTVSGVFGLGEDGNGLTTDQLVHHLQPLRALLCVDNCEHVLPGCSQTAEALLRGCPHLRILTTS